MLEGTPRRPHVRRYVKPGEEYTTAQVDVDDHGFVLVSEELLDRLLLASGYRETTKDPA